MSVQDQTPFNRSVANGVTTVFPYSFLLLADGDLQVTVDNVVLDEGVDYTVDGLASPSGGNVTLMVPPASGATVLRRRSVVPQRLTDYQQLGDFFSPTVNKDFDRLWLKAQDLDAQIERAIKLPFGDTSGTEVVESPAERASKLVGFDPSGNLTTISLTEAAADVLAVIPELTQDALDELAPPAAQAAVADALATQAPSLFLAGYALFSAFSATIVPAGITQVRSRGFSADGVGAANYLYSASVDAAYVAANPYTSFLTANGRGFMLNEAMPTTAMFGLDATGVADCSPRILAGLTYAASVAVGGVLTATQGRFLMNSSVEMPNNARLIGVGRNLVTFVAPTGLQTLFKVTAGGVAGTEFTDFRLNLAIEECGFEFTTFNSNNLAALVYNVRGFRFNKNKVYRGGGLRVYHGVYLTGVYSVSNGSSTVDPAVVAGFSATDASFGLNRNIEFIGNEIDATQYMCQGLRFNFCEDVVAERNQLAFANISWWGGSAVLTEGGNLQFLRRARSARIYGNRISGVNGAVYGNGGEFIETENNYAENIVDVCYDLEGCFNCRVVNNFARNVGNGVVSAFYAHLGCEFEGNTLVQTPDAANIGALFNTTDFTSSRTVSAAVDNGSGAVRLTLNSTQWAVTGQKYYINSVGGLNGINGMWWPITVINSTQIDLQGSVFSGAYTSDGTARFHRGNVFLLVSSGSFSIAGVYGVEPVMKNNTLRWTGSTHVGYAVQEGNQGSMTFEDNILENVVANFTSTNVSYRYIKRNEQTFTTASQSQTKEHLLYAVASSRTQVCDDNVIRLPAGFVAQDPSINAIRMQMEQAGMSLYVRRNLVINDTGTPLTLAVNLGNPLLYSSTTASRQPNVIVEDNVAPSGGLMSVPGRGKHQLRNNRQMNGTPWFPFGTAAVPAVPANFPDMVVGTQFPWSSLTVSATLGAVAITSGGRAPAYAAGTYAVDYMATSSGNIYVVTTAGTTGGVAPTGTGTAQADGSVVWRYVGAAGTYAPYGSTGAAL